MSEMSVRLSVNFCIVTERKKLLPTSLYHMIIIQYKYDLRFIRLFFDNKNGWRERPFYLKFWATFENADFQSIFIRIAPQP